MTPIDDADFDTLAQSRPDGDVAAAIAAVEARDFAKIEVIGGDDTGLLSLVTPPGATRELLDLYKYEAYPRRAVATVVAHSADGFVEAVKRRSPVADAVVYADEEQRALVAVLNDDKWTDDELGAGVVAGWRDHRVSLALRPTPEWTHWKSNQGLGTQEQFALTVEEGMPDIKEPAAADLLEMAQTFQASISAKFRQQGRLANGQVQLSYEEEVDATAGAPGGGLVTIPTEFALSIAPFYGSQKLDVTCRLRYKPPRSGSLEIGYAIVRPEQVELDSFRDVVQHVDQQIGQSIAGVAPPPRA